MIRPLMRAKRVPPPKVTEVRAKAETGISDPASCSALVPVTWPVGFQLMGQKGLRLLPSSSKEDLFLISNSKEDLFLIAMAGPSAAWRAPRASKIGIKR